MKLLITSMAILWVGVLTIAAASEKGPWSVSSPNGNLSLVAEMKKPSDASSAATGLSCRVLGDSGEVLPSCFCSVAPAPTSSNGACGRRRWTVLARATPISTCNCPPPSARMTKRITVPGFYDGEGVYKVRFSPPCQGQWRYETRSNRPELNGKSGSFTAGPPSADNHGPVQVFKTFYLRYADGTPYHQFGTTCYAWVHQTRGAPAADAQDAGRVALQQDPLLRVPQVVHLQPERAGVVRLSQDRPTASSTSTGPIRPSGVTSSSASWTCSGWASRRT